MNRWALLEHKIFKGNLIDIHFDFLVEQEANCLTWKFVEIPRVDKGPVEIVRQSNHRLIWLTRIEHELSSNRGFVKRLDHGTFTNLSLQSDLKDFQIILDGQLLNGLFIISGNLCSLTKDN